MNDKNPSSGRFTKINDGFTCEHCGRPVPPATRTCRNHCPYCLHSKHVDVYPGDRLSTCGGLMEPLSYENNSKKGLVLVFRCQLCGYTGRNLAALDDPQAPDDYDLILKQLTPRYK